MQKGNTLDCQAMEGFIQLLFASSEACLALLFPTSAQKICIQSFLAGRFTFKTRILPHIQTPLCNHLWIRLERFICRIWGQRSIIKGLGPSSVGPNCNKPFLTRQHTNHGTSCPHHRWLFRYIHRYLPNLACMNALLNIAQASVWL